MITPFPLYVDEISPDNIKGTVYNNSTIVYNLRVMSLAHTPLHNSYTTMIGFMTKESNGVCIMPIGKFICMLVKNDGGNGMILLDLVDKAQLAEKMAEKLDPVSLRQQFKEAYAEVESHPERHKWFKLVVGNARDAQTL